MVFLSDMPTVITFAEFSAKTGIEINGPMTITTILYEYIKSTDKSVMRITDSDFYEATSAGKLIKYHDYVDVDAKHHIHALLEWINNHCTDVVADKALALFSQGDATPLKKQLFSSLSMLLFSINNSNDAPNFNYQIISKPLDRWNINIVCIIP